MTPLWAHAILQARDQPEQSNEPVVSAWKSCDGERQDQPGTDISPEQCCAILPSDMSLRPPCVGSCDLLLMDSFSSRAGESGIPCYA